MKLHNLALAPIAAALMAIGTPALAANSLTFQGVTFETQALSSNELQFTILNATTATGDWSGVNYLEAFDFQAITSSTDVDPATSINPGDLSLVDAELTAHGCSSGDPSGSVCFQANNGPISLSNAMSWTINFGNTSGLNLNSPDLKVEFLKNSTDTKNTGSLLSEPLPVVTLVPEPETYAMLLAGLGFLGFMASRRKQETAA
jgi:PEP-CTERM motif